MRVGVLPIPGGLKENQYFSVGDTVSKQVMVFSTIGCIETVFWDVRNNGLAASALFLQSNIKFSNMGKSQT